jgi:hypothetical protein
MSQTQILSLITLLLQKGDPKILGNYRPISLTNTDYKILAFFLAKKNLQNILNKTININQSAYIKRRKTALNSRLIVCIFEYCEKNDIFVF